MQSEKTLSRRGFLQGCVVVGSSLIVAGAVVSRATAADGGSLEDVQYGFLVNLDKCVGCQNCVAACRYFNELSDDTPDRRVVQTFKNGKDIDVYVSTSCMHCAYPSCEAVCPSGAIHKGEAGIVSTDKDRCIGCKYCFQACPYGVPHYNAVAMDKCDCCLDAGIAPGETPYCAQNCKFNALKYGPLDDLMDEARDQAVPVGEPNGPSCLLVGEGR